MTKSFFIFPAIYVFGFVTLSDYTMHILLYNMKLLVYVFEITCLQRGGKWSAVLHYLSNTSHQMLIGFYVTSAAYEIGHLKSRNKELNFSLHMPENSHYLFLSFLSNVFMSII